jgi:hypothetical protein
MIKTLVESRSGYDEPLHNAAMKNMQHKGVIRRGGI